MHIKLLKLHRQSVNLCYGMGGAVGAGVGETSAFGFSFSFGFSDDFVDTMVFHPRGTWQLSHWLPKMPSCGSLFL